MVLNLQPEGKNLKVNDIQEVVSAYAKTYNPLEFLRTGDVIYLNRKRVNRLFYRMEIDIPITANLNGSIGRVTCKFDNVKIDGKPYNKAFEENNNSNKSIRHPLSEDSTGKPLTEGQKKYFKDSKAVDENGNLKVMYHGTPSEDFTVFGSTASQNGIFFGSISKY